MASACTRMIGKQYVSLADAITAKSIDLVAYGEAHRAQMDRQMGCIGHQTTVGREERTTEVQPFLYVGTDRGLLQGASHCLGDAHEARRKERQEDRIWLRFIL